MGEDKNDTQLPLSKALAGEEERGKMAVAAARQNAKVADKVLEDAGNMTTSIPIPAAQAAAREAEIRARALEAELKALDQDRNTLTVPLPTRHIRRAGHHNPGRHSTKVPLHLLRPLPGLEDASPSLVKGGK